MATTTLGSGLAPSILACVLMLTGWSHGAAAGSIVLADDAEVGSLPGTWTALNTFSPGHEYSTAQAHTGLRSFAVNGALEKQVDQLSDRTFEIWVLDDNQTAAGRSATSVASAISVGEFGTGNNIVLGIIDAGFLAHDKYTLYPNGGSYTQENLPFRTPGWHRFGVVISATGDRFEAYVDGEKVYEADLDLGLGSAPSFQIVGYSLEPDSVRSFFDDLVVSKDNAYNGSKIQRLISTIDELEADGTLSSSQAKVLRGFLNNALNEWYKDKPEVAANLLSAFKQHVESLMRSGHLPEVIGDSLIAAAEEVVADLRNY